MTVGDLISRLESFVRSKSRTAGVERTAQVKIGKQFNNDSDVFEYFDIIRKDGSLILVPSDKWERKL